MTEPAPAPDLDLRLVRYFVAVAEHRHFGRAAARLHLTQPSLSRQIHRLEHQLGARLLDRTPQGNTLTAAGEVFLPRARALLRSADQTVAVTRAAAEPSRIVVGFTRGLIVTPAVRALRHRHPDADVQTVFVEFGQATAALLDHRVDAVVTRLPVPTAGLRVTVLREEPRMLMMPVDHPLVEQESSPSTTSRASRCCARPTRSGTPTGASTPGPTAARCPTGRWPSRSRTSSRSSPAARRWPSSPPLATAACRAPT